MNSNTNVEDAEPGSQGYPATRIYDGNVRLVGWDVGPPSRGSN